MFQNAFPVQCKMFLKSLDGLVHQCEGGKNKGTTEIQEFRWLWL